MSYSLHSEYPSLLLIHDIIPHITPLRSLDCSSYTLEFLPWPVQDVSSQEDILLLCLLLFVFGLGWPSQALRGGRGGEGGDWLWLQVSRARTRKTKCYVCAAVHMLFQVSCYLSLCSHTYPGVNVCQSA